MINKTVIENSNYDNHYIGNYLEIPIGYDSDIDKAVEIMEEVISNHNLVLDMRENIYISIPMAPVGVHLLTHMHTVRGLSLTV